VHDLRRCLDALARLEALDSGRVAFAGLSLGAIVGAAFCAADPRPRAAALALAGGGMGPPELDPVRCVGRIAPRPVLFVNATRDATIPREAAERLHAAAGEPSEVRWFESGHADLPGQAFKAIWGFLRPHLGL
jgi:predicted esterase